MPARTILGALVIDAIDEFQRAIDAVPAPGRHRRLGRLNAPAWSIGHLAAASDAWINVFSRRLEPDAWCEALTARQRAAPPGTAVAVDLDEATAAFARFAERARPYLESSDAETLGRDADVPQRPGGWPVVPATYLLARTVAHTFAHAGELSVTASLVGAGDLRLPGALAAAHAAVRADDETAAVLGALLHDAHDEFTRVAEALPRPAQVAALTRLNAGGFVVAHLAEQQDRAWNVAAAGAPGDGWLRDADVRTGAPASAPPYDEALGAWRRVVAAAAPRIAAAAAGSPDAPLTTGSPGTTVADALARGAAHAFVHAGELASIGSLVGAPDLGLPGRLAHTAAATPRAEP